MRINIIAACDRNNLIGADGKLPWHLPEDMKRFKELTTGHAVIMGRGTFDSMGRKALPDRLNVVITRNLGFGRNRDDAVFVSSHQEALDLCRQIGHKEVFIIGGESVYREAIAYAHKIYLTWIDNEFVVNDPETAKYLQVTSDDKWVTEDFIFKDGYAFLELRKAIPQRQAFEE